MKKIISFLRSKPDYGMGFSILGETGSPQTASIARYKETTLAVVSLYLIEGSGDASSCCLQGNGVHTASAINRTQSKKF
ncbi:hypothetical protein ACFL1V_00780 [Pseudomonadota bacterium]